MASTPRALGELAVTAGRTAKIVAQVRTRLAGQVPQSATRLVSLHDLGGHCCVAPSLARQGMITRIRPSSSSRAMSR
jgi:hypothetical protein